MPESLQTGQTQLMLNGAGIRTKFFFDIYVGGLYLKEKSQDATAIIEANEPMAIRLHILSSKATSKKMEKADNFGDLLAKNIKIGDLVSWSTWNSENFDWDINLGIVLEIKNTILSNRMVCVSTVVPLKDPYGTRELFTFALKVVPSAGETKV